jgi:cbb3-type cytochrome oxidase subunit 3
MNRNSFASLSAEALLKKYNLMRGVLIAFAILYFLVILLLLYLFFNKNFGQLSIAFFVPLLLFPAALAPVYTNYYMLRAEKKSRNL